LFGKGQRLRYLCQDETRLGLKTETGKVIMAFGVKPHAPVLWKRDNFWLYGVVEPLSGWHFCQEYDREHVTFAVSNYTQADFFSLPIKPFK
jgi:hypothetical protein